MQYHVARDGQQMGKISEADLQSGLQDGRFLPTDLVWRDGMAQWTPLGDLKLSGTPAVTSPGPGLTVRRPTSVAGAAGPPSVAGPAPAAYTPQVSAAKALPH